MMGERDERTGRLRAFLREHLVLWLLIVMYWVGYISGRLA